jgi:hypothetical protein
VETPVLLADRYEQSEIGKFAGGYPFLSPLYFIAFLDWANVAYAKLAMAQDLGFSEWVYGFGWIVLRGVSFVGDTWSLIVQRWGLRRWTSRVLLTWGLCAISLSFVHTSHHSTSAASYSALQKVVCSWELSSI